MRPISPRSRRPGDSDDRRRLPRQRSAPRKRRRCRYGVRHPPGHRLRGGGVGRGRDQRVAGPRGPAGGRTRRAGARPGARRFHPAIGQRRRTAGAAGLSHGRARLDAQFAARQVEQGQGSGDGRQSAARKQARRHGAARRSFSHVRRQDSDRAGRFRRRRAVDPAGRKAGPFVRLAGRSRIRRPARTGGAGGRAHSCGLARRQRQAPCAPGQGPGLDGRQHRRTDAPLVEPRAADPVRP